MLSCFYHGWSYDLRGDLVKAPKFEGVDEFDKSENSLFEINVRVDVDGFVFVNVGAFPDKPVPVDVKKFGSYMVNSWQTDVEFNWKLAGKLSSTRYLGFLVLTHVYRVCRCL